MELLRVLASGGFGIVYLARDHWLDRDVAVKEFLPTHLAGRGDDHRVELRTDAGAAAYAQGLQSFIAEAKLLAHFSHPAIVKVHRFWEANGTGYMVMPHLRGPTLGQVRRSMSQPPTEEWLRSIMEPLMAALAMLHAEGVYHRDISPDNVLVSENGLPILLDFGAARSIGNEQSHSPTAILKPRFAPIEQYAEATHLRQGPWTDIYSLGALIAYLLMGTAPPQSTVRAIDDEMKPLRGQRIDGVSPAFLSAIDWALSVRPQDRPQSIAELCEALDGHALVQRARGDTPQTTARGHRRRRPERPFAATVRLDRPLVSPKARERAGRAALLAFASVVLLVAVAPLAPVAVPTRPDAAVAPEAIRELAHERVMAKAKELPDPKAAAEQRETVAAVPSTKVAVVPSTILTPTTSASTAANDARAEPLADRPRARNPKPAIASNNATKRSASRPAGQLEASGPASQCSTRGFFQRTYCMQRACKEPRFQSNVQCVPYQQEARLAHY